MGIILAIFFILLFFFPAVLSKIMHMGLAIVIGVPLAILFFLVLNWAFHDIMGVFK
jgi:hypothetical protein